MALQREAHRRARRAHLSIALDPVDAARGGHADQVGAMPMKPCVRPVASALRSPVCAFAVVALMLTPTPKGNQPFVLASKSRLTMMFGPSVPSCWETETSSTRILTPAGGPSTYRVAFASGQLGSVKPPVSST